MRKTTAASFELAAAPLHSRSNKAKRDIEMQISPKNIALEEPFTATQSRTVTVSNDLDTPIAFKVKTTAPKLYCVRPNSGVVAPRSTLEVDITFQGLEKEPALGAKCKDKFLFVSVPCDDTVASKDVGSVWPQLEASAKGKSTDVKIKVMYNFDNMNTIQEESSLVDPPATPAKKSIAKDISTPAQTPAPATAAKAALDAVNTPAHNTTINQSMIGTPAVQVKKASSSSSSAQKNSTEVKQRNTAATETSAEKEVQKQVQEKKGGISYIAVLLILITLFIISRLV